jgi:plasmid maintenance system antidote protein VapI
MITEGNKVTKRAIAQAAKISPAFLSHIIRGRRRCPPDVAVRLEEVTTINRIVWVWGSSREIRNAVEDYIDSQRGGHGH